MPTNLSAALYVCVAVLIGYGIGRICLPQHRDFLTRATIAWVLVSALLFTTTHAAIFMLGAGLIAWCAAPRDPVWRIGFYAALVIACPPGIEWQISVPGIERLYVFSYDQVLALALLLPTALQRELAKQPARAPASPVHRLLAIALAFVCVTFLLDFRDTTFTNGLRYGLRNLLTTALVVAALGNGAKRREIFAAAMAGILVAGIFNVVIGLLQDRTHWLFYSEVSGNLRLFAIRYDLLMMQRGGALRIPGTLSPIPYGIHMVLCIVASLYFLWSRQATRWVKLLMVACLYLAVRSGSRGALLGLAVALFFFLLLSPKLRSLRPALVAVTVFLLGMFLFTDLFSKFIAVDEHGTFAYRMDLIINSMDSISRHPLFGTPKFLENPVLQRSRQGEGLIDIVNAFLGIVLKYGIVGLVLFVWPLFSQIGVLWRQRRMHEIANDHVHERTVRAGVSMLIGFAAAISTVSFIDHLALLYWLLIFASVGLAGISSTVGVANTARESLMRRSSPPSRR